ncbi:MAG TPA: type II toxin-antitoxin system HicA family toxin [Candidatus Thermoplasmatota archaeon]|nr:type II toxin-antitoxin system HicA family toxin [Candidatus Thermoplasmatota archaeon]
MSYREVHRILQRHGFQPKRQKGSHIFYEHPNGNTTVVPRHGHEIPAQLVAKLLKEAGIDPDTVRR